MALNYQEENQLNIQRATELQVWLLMEFIHSLIEKQNSMTFLMIMKWDFTRMKKIY